MNDDMYQATLDALEAAGDGEDVNPGSEPSAEPAAAPPVKAEATVEESEGREGAPAPVEPLIDDTQPTEPEAEEADKGPIPYARFREVNEARKQAEQRAQELEARQTEMAAANELMTFLQSDPEAARAVFDVLTRGNEAPAEAKKPVTLDDFIAEYDDPAEARAAWAEYKADLANQRLEQLARQQEEARAAEARQAHDAQIQKVMDYAYNQIDRAIEGSDGLLDKNDRDLVFTLAQQTYVAGGVKPEDAVGKAVEQLTGRLKAAHSKQMSEYARKKTQPQPVIQGVGGSAPIDLPPAPGSMSIQEQIAYTEAMLKARSD